MKSDRLSLPAVLPLLGADDPLRRLYEKFRPGVPPGNEGWGKRAVLDVEMIRAAT